MATNGSRRPPSSSSSSASNHQQPIVPLQVFFRSKTILLLVDQLEDVAPAAALCALLGDLYRHRTIFQSKEPIPVIRVAVAPSLRHYFIDTASSNNAPTPALVTWRAHLKEANSSSSSSSSSSRWRTHVGAPDSLWCLEHALEKAFHGHSSSHNSLSHDDGGMADMILVPTASSLSSLTLWQRLAQLMTNNTLPQEIDNNKCPKAASAAVSPLVIGTLGSLRGIDWVSRVAFAMETLQNNHNSPQRGRRQPRPLALMGFPNTLWHCRLVPDSQSANTKRIITPYTKPSAAVLMVGRDSSSIATQPVMMMMSSSSSLLNVSPNECMLLLRQTIFPPQTPLECAPVFDTFIKKQQPHSTSAKPYLYPFLWSLFQDPHLIQFPCYKYIMAPREDSEQAGKTPTLNTTAEQTSSVGSLIISVLVELFFLIQQVAFRGKHERNTPGREIGSDYDRYDKMLLQALADPANPSILSKLLGWGGSIVEDMTQNRMPEILYRLHYCHVESSSASQIIRQTWLLEPLLTRAAQSQWHTVMLQSPFPSTTTTTTTPCHVLQSQLQKDTVDHGLGLVLQVANLYQVELPTIQKVVRYYQHSRRPSSNSLHSAAAPPLRALGIDRPSDLEQFLVVYPSLGGNLKDIDSDGSSKGIHRDHHRRRINIPLSRL